MACCLRTVVNPRTRVRFFASRPFFWCQVSSWSPSLTLFEVALFIDFRDVRATYWLPQPLSPRGARGAMLTD
jgi:hypothetical protein